MTNIETAAALKIADMARGDWNTALSRGQVPWAPKTTGGIARRFDHDELLALNVAGRLLDQFVAPRWAFFIAGEVLSAIRAAPDVVQLNAWKIVRNGEPTVVVRPEKPRGAKGLFEFDIPGLRKVVRDNLAAILSEYGLSADG